MTKIEREKKVVERMIRLFCRHKHRLGSLLCPDCLELCRYAWGRLDQCPFGEKKTKCAKCRVHCYGPLRRESIVEVMRFSGPRLLLSSPITALRYVTKNLKTNKKNANIQAGDGL